MLTSAKQDSPRTQQQPQFLVGDLLRIGKVKRTFEKGYLWNWTMELYTVSKRVPGRYPYQNGRCVRMEKTFWYKEAAYGLKG